MGFSERKNLARTEKKGDKWHDRVVATRVKRGRKEQRFPNKQDARESDRKNHEWIGGGGQPSNIPIFVVKTVKFVRRKEKCPTPLRNL